MDRLWRLLDVLCLDSVDSNGRSAFFALSSQPPIALVTDEDSPVYTAGNIPRGGVLERRTYHRVSEMIATEFSSDYPEVSDFPAMDLGYVDSAAIESRTAEDFEKPRPVR